MTFYISRRSSSRILVLLEILKVFLILKRINFFIDYWLFVQVTNYIICRMYNEFSIAYVRCTHVTGLDINCMVERFHCLYGCLSTRCDI